MKRLRPAVLVVMILAAHSVQAQTDVYTDIVGELESSDDWIVQPDNEPEVFSQASSAQTSAPSLAPPRLAPAVQNMPIFGSPPQRLPDWRRTQVAKLFTTTGSGYSLVLTICILVEVPQQTISLLSTIWEKPLAWVTSTRETTRRCDTVSKS